MTPKSVGRPYMSRRTFGSTCSCLALTGGSSFPEIVRFYSRPDWMVDMAKVALAIWTVAWVSLTHASEPHPQPTYGAIKFMAETSNCLQGWLEDEGGHLYFTYCDNEAALIEELGKLDEADPQHEQKKATLIQLIDAVGEQKK